MNITQKRQQQQTQVWKRQEQQKLQVWRRKEEHEIEPNKMDTEEEFNLESQWCKRNLVGTINKEFEEWLNRSLVCTIEEPRDIATLASAVNNRFGLCSKICALSSFQFILTFPTIDQMEESLTKTGELDQWFSDIKKWSTYDSCETRKVWLEVFEVPPHGWCWENFDKIASIWGRLITLGKSISRTDSFKSMQLMIVTDVFKRIDHDMLLTLGDEGYRLMTCEVGPTTQIVHNGYGPSNSPPLEKMDSSDEVLGFEDLMDNLEVENDMAQSNTRFDDLPVGAQRKAVAQESPGNQITPNSNLKGEIERPAASTNQESIYSRARTKTVSFSQNGYIEELLKFPGTWPEIKRMAKEEHLIKMEFMENLSVWLMVQAPASGKIFGFQISP
ncbi:hypothetical protein Cgig2_030826 [Carnegiea gigantea]|uniref:DUF4283 domain-containing protein n=1 Tax=Carnegiea gigantea TaxID=171969 RepID=A0A9Q1JHD4_9CARY|nr:hypothetical protein Cgig2_030826 [Carnegiea gigantea]